MLFHLYPQSTSSLLNQSLPSCPELAELLSSSNTRSRFKMSAAERQAAFEEARKQMWKPPFDARFPNQNQTRHCWQNYVDYLRCQKIKGEDFAPCEYFKRVYTHLCPGFWVESWDEQRENGCFPAKI
ncbi:cytochrome c oxidase subunit [Plakobranchus ocellatus]|uniref:Cytochrome c oxidase subunit 6B1 n=1 Tax=Plakobranchus ocellatus TaxID=259542 RepID=A0AAV4DLY0_9GAST|nr:cytochrome c oxidase subunit [Plakobranchus ocellatus]